MQRAGLRTALALAIGAFCWANTASAETPAEWAKLGARVHGGYGSFIPLGIKIGLDAATKLKAAPRSLIVTYYDNPKSPCACFADGVAIATTSSFGQRSLVLSPEKAPDDKGGRHGHPSARRRCGPEISDPDGCVAAPRRHEQLNE